VIFPRRTDAPTREPIAGATIEILYADGESALTFPALATRLTTTAGRPVSETRPMTSLAPSPAPCPAASDPGPPPVLDVVVPVFDEERDLEQCVRRLHAHLLGSVPYTARITVADNASTDGTLAVATRLAAELDGVRVVHLDEKGRGRALSAVWSASDAAILAYMDVDLSTDLNALLPLVAPLISGHSDVAIGSRLTRSSRVVRGPRREVVSRCYNVLLRGALAARFSDAQCGFKAIRSDVALRLLPLVEDTGWFFDTELLVLAERSGLRIHEVPVDWVDDPSSTVDIVATAVADLKGVVRVGRALATGRVPVAAVRESLGREPLVQVGGEPAGMFGQLVRFGGIGVVSTLAYTLLFLLLHPSFGAQAANFLALLATAVANTVANRRFTFGVRGRAGATRHQAQGLVVFVVGLALTSGALAGLHAVTDTPPRGTELAVLVVANLLATLTKFVAMRAWVFRDPATTATPAEESAR
jgi:glycosyltransferase involved in cell wall biosynthesis